MIYIKNIKGKILILAILALVILAGIGFLYGRNRPGIKEAEIPSLPAADKSGNQADLEKEYRLKTKSVIENYGEMAQEGNYDKNQYKELKNNLLSLRVPAKYKDLHLSFVFAIIKMENFIDTGNQEDKFTSEKIVKEAKEMNSWLN